MASPPPAERLRAGHGAGLRHLEQVVHVLGPGRAGLLDERAEHALVAGDGARVRRRGGRAGARLAHLQHRHADAALGALRQRLAQARAVAVALEVERDRAHAPRRARARPIQSAGSTATELPHETTVWNRSPRLAASAFTATLPLCDTSATRPRLERRAGCRPTARRAECSATIPLPFGPHTGSEWRAAASREPPLVLRAQRDLAEARAVHDGAAAAERAGLVHHLRHARGRDAQPRPRPAPPAARAATGSRGSRAPRRASGFTPQTGPAKPRQRRFSSVSPAYESSRSLAPTTATLRGRSSRVRSISAAFAPRRGAPARGR